MVGLRLSFRFLGSMRIPLDRGTQIMLNLFSQPFWGDMVAAAGAGPKPIRIKAINRQNLQEAIRFCLSNEASEAAGRLGQKMRAESGVFAAVSSFHRHLHPERLQCDISPERPAVWAHSKSGRIVKLSKICAEILINHLRIDGKDLNMSVKRIFSPCQWS